MKEGQESITAQQSKQLGESPGKGAERGKGAEHVNSRDPHKLERHLQAARADTRAVVGTYNQGLVREAEPQSGVVPVELGVRLLQQQDPQLVGVALCTAQYSRVHRKRRVPRISPQTPTLQNAEEYSSKRSMFTRTQTHTQKGALRTCTHGARHTNLGVHRASTGCTREVVVHTHSGPLSVLAEPAQKGKAGRRTANQPHTA